MEKFDFTQWSHAATDWSTRYLKNLAEKPVRPPVSPGDIAKQIAESPPDSAEPMEKIFEDFENIIPDGMTHWQHPRFFAYFPSNAMPAAVIADQLAGVMASQCMLWQTSPAATELETSMVDWLRQVFGLPESFTGVFQDTASSATLCAVLTMRERALNWTGNSEGLHDKPRLRVYASSRMHSSVDKALWVAGLGGDNLVKIPTREDYTVDVEAMRQAIADDKAKGYLPVGIVANVGGTSTGACDNVREVLELAKAENLYSHVDAAWAGSAMICPEFRHYWDGVELADSIVINPHKWLGTGMECSAHFVKDPTSLVKTLAIQPEYLKTQGHDNLINYSEWSVQLGRRFRALKVWFLLRAYGVDGLREMIRQHVAWTEHVADKLRDTEDFEIITNPMLALFSFRHNPNKLGDNPALSDTEIDAHNLNLVDKINRDGRIYLTQTNHDGQIAIRFTVGTWTTTQDDIDLAVEVIKELARQ